MRSTPPTDPTPDGPEPPESPLEARFRAASWRAGRHRGLIATLLRIPLFYKLLVANGAIVALGAVIGTSVTATFVRAEPDRSTWELVGLLGFAGVVLSILVNVAILRLALAPLSSLEETARRVQSGDVAARAPDSPLADRQIDRLTTTFNAMLESLATYRQRLREVAARALNAAEEERKRVARELHDDTAQRLAALLIRLRLVRGMKDIEQRNRVLEEVRREITETLEGVRHFAHGLRPPALDELGLVPAIQSFARTLTRSSGLPISVTAELPEREGMLLRPEAELALYRIVQEALSNVVRHAEAERAEVRIRASAREIVAIVEDDGWGFSVETTIKEGQGLGLFGMKERAEYIGGTVEIESRPGEGTRVRAVVPTASSADDASAI